MTNFTPKRLPREETLGEKLRQARLAKSLRIEDIAKTIGIRREYLEAIEEERFDLLPSGLYGKSFLKKYASRLGFKPKEIEKEIFVLLGEDRREDPFSQKVVKKNKFIIFPRLVRNVLLATAVLACLLYLVLYSKKVIIPPELVIIQPADNLIISGNSFVVTGQTEAEAEVRINDALVLNNDNGSFSQAVNLKKGVNTLTITSKKKYSRLRSEIRQILVE